MEILLLEDDPNDVFFVEHAIQKNDSGHTLHTVGDGKEAISYLRGDGQYADRGKFPLPNLILTDIKMSGMDGFEFLRWLKEHPECAVIPTIVFSSSSQSSDVKEAYRLGANGYIMKPSTLTELAQVLQATYEFWSRCECPPTPVHC